jgi:hypothetical protein
MGFHFILFFVAGWYLRETSDNLRKFKHNARTAQAVIAVLVGFTGILIPFSIYSFWVLFGHRGRTYYEARARKLSPREAAQYTYRLLEEPYLQETARYREPAQSATPPPAPPPQQPPQPPTPSQIPVQSMVTSQVEPAPAPKPKPHLSPFTKAGLLIIGLSFLAGGLSIAADEVIDMDDVGVVPLVIGGVFLSIGFLHAIFSPKAKGAFFALFAIGAAVAGGVLYEEHYAQPIKRARWEARRAESQVAKIQIGAYRKLPDRRYEYEFMRDNARTAWLQVATLYPGRFAQEVHLFREGNLLVVRVPARYMHNTLLMNDIAHAVTLCVREDLGDDFLPLENYTVTRRISQYVSKNPPPKSARGK